MFAIMMVLLADLPGTAKAWTCVPIVLFTTVAIVAAGGIPLSDGIRPNAVQLAFIALVRVVLTTLIGIAMLDLPMKAKAILATI